MKTLELIAKKSKDINGERPVTVVFLGDSTVQGCFECYQKAPGQVETVFETDKSYAVRFKEIINTLFPSAQVNVINSGISGDSAEGGLKRLERDVLSYNPDLVVVAFGLNDCMIYHQVGPQKYEESMRGIFGKLKEKGVETIFLTENAMCTHVSPFLSDDLLKKIATNTAIVQNGGVPEKFFEVSKKIAKENGVIVCDFYSKWKKMMDAGVDTTELLANKINHPIREYNYYVALKLIETLFEN